MTSMIPQCTCTCVYTVYLHTRDLHFCHSHGHIHVHVHTYSTRCVQVDMKITPGHMTRKSVDAYTFLCTLNTSTFTLRANTYTRGEIRLHNRGAHRNFVKVTHGGRSLEFVVSQMRVWLARLITSLCIRSTRETSTLKMRPARPYVFAFASVPVLPCCVWF